LLTGALLVAMMTNPTRSADRVTAVPPEVDPAGFASLVDVSAPVAVEGEIRGAGGLPVQGNVEALAWPNDSILANLAPGVPFHLLPVGAATAGPDGQFELRFSLQSVSPDYRAADGQVDLELVAWDGTNIKHYFVSVRGDVAGGKPQWVNPTAGNGLSAADALAARVKASLRLSEPGLITTTDGSPKVGCSVWLVSSYTVWSQIGESVPYATTQTSWMFSGVSHSASVGAALKLGGVWSASGTTSESTTTEITYATNYFDRFYDEELRYGIYDNNCGTPRSFHSIQATGGYRERNVSFDPSWTHCAAVPAGSTWTRSTQGGNNFTYGAAVQSAGVIGINLSLTTSYSATRKLSYHQTVARHVCGNDDDPSVAGRIKGAA
jgi:hypothetical protein